MKMTVKDMIQALSLLPEDAVIISGDSEYPTSNIMLSITNDIDSREQSPLYFNWMHWSKDIKAFRANSNPEDSDAPYDFDLSNTKYVWVD